MAQWRMITGYAQECLSQVEKKSVQSVITGPPYHGSESYCKSPRRWLDGWVGDLGCEPTSKMYASHLGSILAVVYDCLKDEGTLFLVLGGPHPSSPWETAMQLRKYGWVFVFEFIWDKVYEKTYDHVFLFGRSHNFKVFQPPEEQVWTTPSMPYQFGKFSSFPSQLVENCLLIGSRMGDLVLDPFAGQGTVGEVALEMGRKFIGIEQDLDWSMRAEENLRRTHGEKVS